MALFVNRDEKRSQYQEKLAAELKGKLSTSDIRAEKPESTMLADDHETRPAGMMIGLLLLGIFIVVIGIIFLLG